MEFKKEIRFAFIKTQSKLKKMKTLLKLAMLLLIFTACGNPKEKENQTNTIEKKQERIISLNGTISEILVALGQESSIVGVDVTSSYPENLKTKAQDLGHISQLSIEALMELKPTLILAVDKELNEDLKKQLEQTGISLKLVSHESSIEGTKKTIKDVAKAMDLENGDALIAQIDNDLTGIQTFNPKPKVLFIYARGAGMLMVSGTGTPIDEMIQLAGGENVISTFSDYKPLTPESLLSANPDYILLFTTGLSSVDGVDGVLKIDGIAQTNAGKNKKIIAMDGQLLSGFSPRVGQAIKELNHLLSK